MRLRLDLLALLLASFSAAAAEDRVDEWQFHITPYLWLPTISGNLTFEPPPGGGGPGLDVGPTDWLDLLNGIALVNGGMTKGRFSLVADLVYLSLKSDDDKVIAARTGADIPVDASLNLATRTEFDGISWTLVGGYTVKQSDRSSMDLIGGVRFFGIDIEANWNLALDITGPGGGVVLPAQGSIKQSVDLWDAIIGVHGHFVLGETRWSVPYYLDVGTGSSDLTWQALTGFSYAYRWGDLMLVYRHLAYDEGNDGLMQDFKFSGPTFGARFRF